MPRHWLYAGIAVALFTVTATSAAAQSGIQDSACKGIIHGIASDQQGHPVPGMKLVLSPLGVDMDVMLPEAQTNQSGEYRFTHVCPGSYTVLPDSLKLVLPRDRKFVYAYPAPEAKLTDKNTTAEIPVKLPKRPGTH